MLEDPLAAVASEKQPVVRWWGDGGKEGELRAALEAPEVRCPEPDRRCAEHLRIRGRRTLDVIELALPILD